jgi:AbiJ N-terminal domain 4
MLTDIFLNRYAGVTLWETFEETDRRFLVQAFRIISEQLYPYWTDDGKERPLAKAQWQSIHDKLSMELGLEELSPRTYLYNTGWAGQTRTQVGFFTPADLCKNFVLASYDGSVSADCFMKERMSLIEIAFRERAGELEATAARRLAQAREQLLRTVKGRIRVPGNPTRGMQALIDRENQEFRNAVDELNTPMRQAGYKLHYHNGFIQRSTDQIIEDLIEEPFWDLVSDAAWKNVDVDIKEAIDRRDNGDRDLAFYAARALESTIKIISDAKGWTHGGEKGANNYIDNLGSKRAGPFIESWERDMLKAFFTHVRNPLGHELSPEQTDWAIEFCMCWIKSLIQRM